MELDKKSPKNSIKFLVVTSFILLFLNFYLVSGACIIKSYSKNSAGNFMEATVTTKCVNSGEVKISDRESGQATHHSFGGPGDNCNDYCGNILIESKNTSLSLLGYSDKSPMNSLNESNWSSTTVAHWNNVTLSLDLPSNYVGLTSGGGTGSNMNLARPFNRSSHPDLNETNTSITPSLTDDKNKSSSEVSEKGESKTNLAEWLVYSVLIIIIIFVGTVIFKKIKKSKS